MGTQTVISGCIIYFVSLFILTVLFSIAGVFPDNEVIVDDRFSASLSSNNDNVTEQADVRRDFSLKTTFKDVFSFFVWNFAFTDNSGAGSILVDYLWLIRIIFIYFPLTILTLAIYYSVPLITGG